ncbi:MAG: hypothetical protein JNJ99_02675 [Crocinitomicaceae bacterium]|nr:hypothetical protein [Crocinitomicaceae bacterium]
MKSIGLGLLGVGALGCVIYPMGYIPSALYFITEMGAGVTWSVLIGLVVLGGVLAYLGMKGEKAENQSQG